MSAYTTRCLDGITKDDIRTVQFTPLHTPAHVGE